MRMEDKKIKQAKIGAKNWIVVILLGLAGQIAWNVENSWFNTFVYDTITKNPEPIAWMVAISAITATITTLIMGTISDRLGKRKPFILMGYILWGLSTVLFPTTAYIKSAAMAVVMVIIADGIMTFFGSTAYDAAYNAWTTDISDSTNRGSISGAITILPLVATIIGAGLSGIIIDSFGYYNFFYSLGAIVMIIGVVGGLLLKDSPKLTKKEKEASKSFIKELFSVFKADSIRANRELFLVLSALALYMVSVQIFIPYQMIYMNNYLGFSKSSSGIISAIPIIIAMSAAIPAGKLTNKGYGLELSMIAPIISFAGLIAFSFSKEIFFIIIFALFIYVGYIVLLISTGAWIKNLMPEDSRGQFEGVRMIFNVAIPMVIGPSIGSFLISNYGLVSMVDGETGFIPTPIVFQAAAVMGLVTLIPLIIIYKNKKKRALINTKGKGI